MSIFGRAPFNILVLVTLGLATGCAHRGEPEHRGDEQVSSSAAASSAAPSARAQRAIADEIHPVFFDFDSTELNAASQAILNSNIVVFKRWPDMQIRISGHTDEEGDLTYNLNLGGERASNVRRYLIDHGIDLSRIVIGSEGEHPPDSTVDTLAESRAERRSEFNLTWDAPRTPRAASVVD